MDLEKLVLLLLEVGSVAGNIAFLLLLTKERLSAWLWGILGSLLGAMLFYQQDLFSETLLYLFYAAMGVYGWLHWKQKASGLKVQTLSLRIHAALLIGGSLITWQLGSAMDRLGADRSYYDAFSTVFGIIATFLEVNKVLSGWLYWIVLNAFSIWLYASKGLVIYALLMACYTYLSVQGFRSWKKAMPQKI